MDFIIALTLSFFFILVFFIFGSLINLPDKEVDLCIKGIIQIALGMGFYGSVLFFLGHISEFKIEYVAAASLLIVCAGYKQLPAFRNWLLSLVFILFPKSSSGIDRILQILFGVFLCIALVLCRTPEIAGDSLVYQLNIPKVFAMNKSTVPIYYDLNSYFPMLMNYLYSVGMIFNSVSLAKLFHFWTGFLLVCMLIAYCLDKTKGRTASLAAGLFLLFTPTLWNQIAVTYVDIGMSFFNFTAYYCCQKAFALNSKKWAASAGLLLGFAISTKFLFLMSGIAYAALAILHIYNNRNRQSFEVAIAFLIGVAAASGIWFIRNHVLTQDVIFPFLSPYFLDEAGTRYIGNYGTYGPEKTFLNFIAIPWNLVVHPYFLKSGFWPGPIYLLSIPFVIYSAMSDKENQKSLLFILIFLVPWFFLAQRERYLLPLFPLILALASAGYTNWSRKKGSHYARMTAAGFLALMFFMSILSLYHYRHAYAAAIGVESNDNFVRNHERTFAIAQWANENLPDNSTILLIGEHRQLYFRHRTIRDDFFVRRENYAKLTPPKRLALLKKRAVTHLLVAHPIDKSEEAPHLLSEIWINPITVNELFSIKSDNEGDDRFEYRLFKLAQK